MEVLDIPEFRKAIVPISLENYWELCKKDPDRYQNTELFKGIIINKMTKSSEHNFYKNVFTEEIRKILPTEFFIQNENSLIIGESELEPDISVIRGNLKDYKHKKPSSARLIVEISFSSLSYDRNKALEYARAGIEEYWIVDIESERVEVYKNPTATGYLETIQFTKNDSIPIMGGIIVLSRIFE